MTSREPLSPGRQRVALILGLVLAIATFVTGLVVVVLNLNPLFGWFFLVVGAVVAVIAILQLVRQSRG